VRTKYFARLFDDAISYIHRVVLLHFPDTMGGLSFYNSERQILQKPKGCSKRRKKETQMAVDDNRFACNLVVCE
jgi:hypothetical protein